MGNGIGLERLGKFWWGYFIFTFMERVGKACARFSLEGSGVESYGMVW